MIRSSSERIEKIKYMWVSKKKKKKSAGASEATQLNIYIYIGICMYKVNCGKKNYEWSPRTRLTQHGVSTSIFAICALIK